MIVAPSRPLRVIIAGSRGYRGGALGIERAVKAAGFNIGTVISGAARGADLAGERWAEANEIFCERYPADWTKYGKRAGFLRNKQMAETADALIALWDGKSRGTLDMIQRMAKKLTCIYWENSWDAEPE